MYYMNVEYPDQQILAENNGPRSLFATSHAKLSQSQEDRLCRNQATLDTGYHTLGRGINRQRDARVRTQKSCHVCYDACY